MNHNISVRSIPISNDSSAEILIALEPEGETHPLAPGQICHVTALPEFGVAQDLEFEIAVGDGIVSVFLVCEKSIAISNQRE